MCDSKGNHGLNIKSTKYVLIIWVRGIKWIVYLAWLSYQIWAESEKPEPRELSLGSDMKMGTEKQLSDMKMGTKKKLSRRFFFHPQFGLGMEMTLGQGFFFIPIFDWGRKSNFWG